MVLGDLLCALHLASSAMVNGVCCYYQMHEEEERRKEHQAVIQRAIRNELEVHRQKDMLQRRHEKEVGSVVSQYQEERRRNLMAQKASVTRTINTDQESGMIGRPKDELLWSRDECESSSQRELNQAGQNLREPGMTYFRGRANTDGSSISSTFTKRSSLSPEVGSSLHSSRRSFVLNSNDSEGIRESILDMQRGSGLSSLFDDSLDEDDFDEIAIE